MKGRRDGETKRNIVRQVKGIEKRNRESRAVGENEQKETKGGESK